MSNIRLEEILKSAKPFDLLLFRGTGTYAHLITYCTQKRLKSPPDDTYSHCGLIIDRFLINDERMEYNKLYILESTLSLDVRSIHHKRPVIGVQVRPLEEVLKHYLQEPYADVAYCRLNGVYLSHIDINGVAFRNRFWNIYNRVLDKFYDANPCSLLGAIFPCMRKIRSATQLISDPESFLFCSELITVVLKSCGILNDRINPSNVVPQDFIGYDEDKEIPDELYVDRRHVRL